MRRNSINTARELTMHLDAIVIGGSYAGLSAAIYIARARRTVLIVDAGSHRNRFADLSHGFFGQDGRPPLEMIRVARQQVLAYPSSSFIDGRAVRARKTSKGFEVDLATGETFSAHRLVIATGVKDLLPDVTGLRERWEKTVIHCPYCHEFEFAEKRLGVLALGPMSVHQAMLVSEWGKVTFFTNGVLTLTSEDQARLKRSRLTSKPGR